MKNLVKRFPVYSQLLRLYPPSYRQKYSAQTLQTLADMLDNSTSRRARLAIWARTIPDFPLALARQQLSYAGGSIPGRAPSYVKRSALLGGILLMPFLLALIANGLDKIFYGRTLHHSWLWHMPALAIWVLWLPLAAAVITLISLAFFLAQSRPPEFAGHWRQLFKFSQSWPLILVGLAGLAILAFVFGHDSVHCLTGNPLREIHHWHGTWQCIKQG